MSRWTDTFKFVQVFFLIAVIVNLLVFSGILFADKLYLDYDEVYQKSVLERIDDFDELNPAPTRQELAWLSFIFRIVIICVAPASIFIYHTRLLTLEAFQDIKKYQFD